MLASNIWIAAIKSLHSFIEAMLRTAVRFSARRTAVDKTGPLPRGFNAWERSRHFPSKFSRGKQSNDQLLLKTQKEMTGRDGWFK